VVYQENVFFVLGMVVSLLDYVAFQEISLLALCFLET
jgi:hypothetical protein